jgi:hypothetical protein
VFSHEKGVVPMKKECESCGSEVSRVHPVDRNYPPKKMEICDVCYETQCGSLGLYPTNVVDGHILLRAMAQCTNMVLAAIKKGGKA